MSGIVGSSGRLFSSSSGLKSRKDLHAPPPAASVTANCCSARRSCRDSLDGEMLISVPTEACTSEAKELLPAIKPLKKDEATKIDIVRYICCCSSFESHEEATIMPAASRSDRTLTIPPLCN